MKWIHYLLILTSINAVSIIYMNYSKKTNQRFFQCRYWTTLGIPARLVCWKHGFDNTSKCRMIWLTNPDGILGEFHPQSTIYFLCIIASPFYHWNLGWERYAAYTRKYSTSIQSVQIQTTNICFLTSGIGGWIVLG